MTEGIDVPSDFRRNSECLLNELVTHHHVIDYVIEVWTRLVIVDPPSVYEFDLAVLDHLLHDLLRFVTLPIPPHLEVACRGLCEFPLGILLKLLNDSIKRKLHTRHLLPLVGPCIILIDRLIPAHVVVRVWDTMYNQLIVLIDSPKWWHADFLLTGFRLHFKLIHLLLHPLLVLIRQDFLWLSLQFCGGSQHHLQLLLRLQPLQIFHGQLLALHILNNLLPLYFLSVFHLNCG